jgi:DNA adenine methylase
VKLVAGDFTKVVDQATAGDFAYLDSPYHPISATSSFAQYTAEGFDEHDHVRLRDIARNLKKRGVSVLLSHADHPVIRQLYEGFAIEQVVARRSINSRADGRGAVAELLIR